jgi:hypothetical protein
MRCGNTSGEQRATLRPDPPVDAQQVATEAAKLLAPAAKTPHMVVARKPLAIPQPNPVGCGQAAEFKRRVAAIEIERFPHCQKGSPNLTLPLPSPKRWFSSTS